MNDFEQWRVVYNNPAMVKFAQLNFKLNNNGSFGVDIKNENPINNVSCVVIKRTITQSNRFLVIASGADMLLFSREKLLQCAVEGKPVPGYAPMPRHSVPFEIHSV